MKLTEGAAASATWSSGRSCSGWARWARLRCSRARCA